MATRLTTAVRNASADAAVDLVDSGAAAGLLRIYTGAQPAAADDAATGTLLVELTMPDPAFGAAAAGAAALASAISGTAVAAGDAGWCRITNDAGTAVFDGNVTATGGGGELELDNIAIANGQTVNVTALTYTQPASTA